MKRRFVLFAFIALLFASIFVLGCTSRVTTTTVSDISPELDDNQDTQSVQTTQPAQRPPAQQEGAKEPVTPSVKEFSMTAKQWEFIPSTITVRKGDSVRLKITSVDVEHGFGLPDFGIRESISPGEITTIEFIADKTGTFRFFCTVPCGQGHGGMDGTLIVEP